MAIAPKILWANGASLGGGGGVPLPSFQFPGMPVGFIVQDSTGGNWQLVASSAVVDHTTVEKCAVNAALRWVTYSGGGGGGGFPATATAITKDNTGTPTGNIPLSGLSGPGSLWFKADGTPEVSTSWFARCAQFVTEQVPTLKPVVADDLMQVNIAGLPFATNAPTGSGTVGLIPNVKPGGVLKVSTGGTATSTAGFQTASTTGTVGAAATFYRVFNLRTSKYAQAVKVQIVATAATFTMELCCWSDFSTADVNFGAIQATSGTNWCCKLGTAAAVDLGVAFTTGVFVTLIAIADGTNFKFYVGDANGANIVQVGTAQSQSTCPNAQGALQNTMANLGTAANAESQYDKVMLFSDEPA